MAQRPNKKSRRDRRKQSEQRAAQGLPPLPKPRRHVEPTPSASRAKRSDSSPPSSRDDVASAEPTGSAPAAATGPLAPYIERIKNMPPRLRYIVFGGAALFLTLVVFAIVQSQNTRVPTTPPAGVVEPTATAPLDAPPKQPIVIDEPSPLQPPPAATSAEAPAQTAAPTASAPPATAPAEAAPKAKPPALKPPAPKATAPKPPAPPPPAAPPKAPAADPENPY